jgi:hypothetical protein
VAVDPRVRKALQAKLGGVSRQAINERAQRLARRLPMSPEDAEYVIAHQQGVPLGRYLDADTLTRISGYVTQLNGVAAQRQSAAPKAKATAKQVVVEIGGIKIDAVPGLTPAHAKEAKIMAEKVYPVLYVFENSVRDVIASVLEANFGADWWEKAVPDPIKKEVAKRMKKEGKEAWHSKRGIPIQHADLPWLADIVSDPNLWPYFKSILPRQNWLDSVIDDMNVSRRVVAHMNPISSDDIKSVENGYRKWVKQLREKASELP